MPPEVKSLHGCNLISKLRIFIAVSYPKPRFFEEIPYLILWVKSISSETGRITFLDLMPESSNYR